MNEKQQLKKQIQQKELQIKKLNLHSASNVCDTLCNRLILEKAILKKELENLCKNKFFEKIKKSFRREKLICDYFKN